MKNIFNELFFPKLIAKRNYQQRAKEIIWKI